MTLSDPRLSLADDSSLIGYLMGVAAITQAVDQLAQESTRESAGTADDFVYLLLGVASLGRSVEHLVGPAAVAEQRPATTPRRWLR